MPAIEATMTVAKLKGARDRVRRKVSAALAERGFVAPSGRPYSASAVASMLAGRAQRHDQQ
jgi:hypothetical protein